jgi:hypothetical protein
MTDYECPDAAELAAWLGDPANAEPCATFPLDRAGVAGPGVYAWHGDAVASEIVGLVLGSHVHPLFVDQAGGRSVRTNRASSATLESAIGRTHLRGSTQASSFRRSLAAVLWNELDLRCERPKRLDAESNTRLTAWMLEHLSVATLPVDDRLALTLVTSHIADRLDPPCNLVNQPTRPARQLLRKLRAKYFTLATADDERIRRIADMERLVALDPEGGDFLRRRLQQEVEKLQTEWAS